MNSCRTGGVLDIRPATAIDGTLNGPRPPAVAALSAAAPACPVAPQVTYPGDGALCGLERGRSRRCR
jgi:hypothetical protein